MISQTYKQTKTEAVRKLEAFVKTGIEGFRQQGIDRLVAMGIETARNFKTVEEVKHLINHVTLYC